jgi:small ligand-binding sensory domain FIST
VADHSRVRRREIDAEVPLRVRLSRDPRFASDHELTQALSATLVGLITATEDVPTRPGQFGADTVVRHLVGVDRRHQTLAIAEQIEHGMRLAEAAQLDLVRIATEIRDELESGTWRRGLCQLLGTRRPALRRAACRVAGGAERPG